MIQAQQRPETLGHRAWYRECDGRAGERRRDDPAVPQYYHAEAVVPQEVEVADLRVIPEQRQIVVEETK